MNTMSVETVTVAAANEPAERTGAANVAGASEARARMVVRKANMVMRRREKSGGWERERVWVKWERREKTEGG